VLTDGKPGSEIETPMAIVILWGLGSATFLNLMVMPALYLRFGALRADFVSRGEAVGSPGGSADFS